MIQEQLINYSNVQLNAKKTSFYEVSTSPLIVAIFFILSGKLVLGKVR